MKKKTVIIVLVILGGLYLMAGFAPFFSPYQYDADDPLYSYAPPTKIHIFNPQAKSLGLFVYQQGYKIDQYYKRVYFENKSQITPVRFFSRGFEYRLLGIKTNFHLFQADGSKIFILGADLKGRDLFSRILYGSRISLSIGLIGALISFAIGLLIGGIAGYFGGRTDNILMRLCEMLMMVPAFYLILALRSSFPPGLNPTHIYLLIIVIFSLIGWASTARVIRGMALTLKERDYVLAAKASGVGDLEIIIRHILPHTFSFAIASIVLSIPSYILGESALSLIGLGIQEPQASWGNLLSDAMGIVNIRLFPWILYPGLFILTATICFNILGNHLQEAADPKRKTL